MNWKAGLEYLKGKKTNLLAFLMIVVGFFHAGGLVNDYWFQMIQTVLGGSTLMALRAGVKKAEHAVSDTSPVLGVPSVSSKRTMHD